MTDRDDRTYTMDGTTTIGTDGRLRTVITLGDRADALTLRGARPTAFSHLDDTYQGDASWTMNVPRDQRHAVGTSAERYRLYGSDGCYDRSRKTAQGDPDAGRPALLRPPRRATAHPARTRGRHPPGPHAPAGLAESIPGRGFFHSPRVKSGISCGRPRCLMDRWLSGTGAVQVAASYTSKSGTSPRRMHCVRRNTSM